jgi:hypothetical protein
VSLMTLAVMSGAELDFDLANLASRSLHQSGNSSTEAHCSEHGIALNAPGFDDPWLHK